MKKTLYPYLPILLVDDEEAWLRSFSLMLERRAGINNVATCSDPREVIKLLGRQEFGLVILDYTMPHLSGTELLEMINHDYPSIAVIILTGRNDIELAVNCMRGGAYDYFIKTMEDERLISGVNRAIRMQEIERENRKLRDGVMQPGVEFPEAFTGVIAATVQMRGICKYVEAISASSQPVLVTGESGVGKELIARAIHQTSRPDGPWVPVNVAGLDDSIFSDTLFGHAKGAFTDADKDRSGMIDKAAGGVLFLDEIGSLNLASQAKLLRVLQDQEFFPLGSDRPRRLKARIVAATNQDLEALQRSGEFRKDLYYRLRTHLIQIPPLRERRDDLQLLLDYFLQQSADELGKPKPTPPRELLTLLGTYEFPGNVRELKAIVFDAVTVHQSYKLSMEHFKQAIGHGNGSNGAERGGIGDSEAPAELVFPSELPTLKEASRQLIDAAMERAGGNQGIAASLLGMSRPALNKRLKKLEEEED